MIILLKIILSIFLGLLFFVGRYMYLDLKNTKKTSGYDESSIWQRFVVSLVFYVILAALLTLCVFLGYFLIMPISIGG